MSSIEKTVSLWECSRFLVCNGYNYPFLFIRWFSIVSLLIRHLSAVYDYPSVLSPVPASTIAFQEFIRRKIFLLPCIIVLSLQLLPFLLNASEASGLTYRHCYDLIGKCNQILFVLTVIWVIILSVGIASIGKKSILDVVEDQGGG